MVYAITLWWTKRIATFTLRIKNKKYIIAKINSYWTCFNKNIDFLMNNEIPNTYSLSTWTSAICNLFACQFFGCLEVLGQENKHVDVFLGQPNAPGAADNAWRAKHALWSTACGWNAQVLSGKIGKNGQGGFMGLPPGERVFCGTNLFDLFIQEIFTCKTVWRRGGKTSPSLSHTCLSWAVFRSPYYPY